MYKTTREENEILTRTGRGTPMGEFLRRYWWPIGISAHLKAKPTFCAHRRANLCPGDIERHGVHCRYHGWLYDTEGKLVQIPGERADSPRRRQWHKDRAGLESL